MLFAATTLTNLTRSIVVVVVVVVIVTFVLTRVVVVVVVVVRDPDVQAKARSGCCAPCAGRRRAGCECTAPLTAPSSRGSRDGARAP